MKYYVLIVTALLFLCCEAAPPAAPPEPDHLAEDIAKLNADYLACMRRENERLRQEVDDLDAKIRIALEEAAVLASQPPKRSKKQP